MTIAVQATSQKIVVIGAGIAGLTTAYRLHKQGYDVEVYEARKRIGGRVLSVKIEDSIAELGGQNILDGGDAQYLRALIKELGLTTVDSRRDFGAYYFNGKECVSLRRLLQEQGFDAQELYKRLQISAQKSKNMRDVLKDLFKEDDLLYKSLSVMLSGYEGAAPEKLSPLYIETLYRMLIDEINVAGMLNKKDKYMHHESVQGGNSLLLEKMAEKLDGRVHTNMPLTTVKKEKNGIYTLIFKNRKKVTADILVLALPCPVYSDIAFERGVILAPTLKSIKQVQYGTNAKIAIPLPEGCPKKDGLLNDHTILFFNTTDTILNLYYTGVLGTFSTNTVRDIYKKNKKIIETGLGIHCWPVSKPVIAREELFAEYDSPVGYSWSLNKYSKGSYSYIAAGQEKLLTAMSQAYGEQVKTLFAPINGNIFFAGEHASIMLDFPGTMEAACESGERTARMIMKII